ncbi:hypothetical protein WJX74_003259 [Apatococcus lobatus]|uniref:Uncharacterized protein n=1 Tax=Apatococcus lobatus TaxID=904363 RepID=A0AAW1S5G3_9CHLO
MGRQQTPSLSSDLDLAFLDGLSELQVAKTPGDLSLHPGSSAASYDIPFAEEVVKPSKGQRYRQNKKAASGALVARIAELRRAVELKEAERQGLILQQTALETGRRAAQGTRPTSDIPSSQAQPTSASDSPAMMPEFLPACLANRDHILDIRISESLTRQLTVEEAANLPLEEFMLLWKDCITQLTELLLEADGDPLSTAAQQVGQVMSDWELVVGSKRLYNHRSTREIFSAPSSLLQTIAGVECEQVQPVDWHSVIQAMALSQQQRLQLIQVRRAHLSAVQQLLADRQAILRKLQDLQSQPHDGTMRDMTQQAQHYQEVLKDFNQNLEQDLILYLEMSDQTKKRILTLFQKATMLVLTWPHVFDILELLNQLAAQANEPSSKQILNECLLMTESRA